jgi:hypothetical protein
MKARAARTARMAFAFAAIVPLAAIVMAARVIAAEPAAGTPVAPENVIKAEPLSGNQILNGQFIKGAGNSPDHWRTEGWDQKPEVSSYVWHHSEQEEGGPGLVEIDSTQPNDARWMQSLSLGAGWYYFSVDARTSDVGKEFGATLSIMEDGISSQELKGTTDWTRIGLYLKVGGMGADIEMALRLGGYSSLNTGKAFFRDATLIVVPGPPHNAEHVFDLDAIRKASQTPPIGRPWTLVVVFMMLGGVAYYGWQLFSEATMPPARPAAVPAAAPKPVEKPKAEHPRDEPPKKDEPQKKGEPRKDEPAPKDELPKEPRKPARGKKKQRKRK